MYIYINNLDTKPESDFREKDNNNPVKHSQLGDEKKDISFKYMFIYFMFHILHSD